ncbi:MAG TPA: 4'-phosphopantetheinyl transferase superfamily protein [Chloroflexota bacterium]|nr:4'-phosphopantetheinyl transferase superfamily protein [Chloroflexota bacterium]
MVAGGADEPNLWRWSLRQPPAVVEQCRLVVSEEERRRANRYATDALRTGKVVGWAGLRLVLGQALGRDPRGLDLSRDARGKLHLVSDQGDGGLAFNLSHTEEEAVCAVFWGASVGVDVEPERPDLEAVVLARAATDDERAWCDRAGERERARRVVTVWTRKEAYLKALGVGLAGSLTEACFCRVEGAMTGQLGPWRVRDFSLTTNLVGSVCWGGGDYGRGGGGCARPTLAGPAFVPRSLPLTALLDRGFAGFSGVPVGDGSLGDSEGSIGGVVASPIS